jgi:hypothetical protein
MKRFWTNNSLLLVAFFGFFLVFQVGQAVVGVRAYNEEQVQHGEPEIALAEYLTTGHFVEATFENWESEFLQMGAYVLLTVWLKQKGSAESKPVDGRAAQDEDPRAHQFDRDAPGPVRAGGWKLKLYENSLSIAFFTLFAIAFVLHAIGGAEEASEEAMEHGLPPISAGEFVRTAEFWFQSLQNWQSEFLAVAAIVFLSIFLRQHGSPESKPVHAPHSATGS